jgi:hypothetical protein
LQFSGGAAPAFAAAKNDRTEGQTKIAMLGCAGLFLGGILGGIISIGIGIGIGIGLGMGFGIGLGFACTTLFHTTSFEGYSGMLVFFSFMPIGIIVGGAGWRCRPRPPRRSREGKRASKELVRCGTIEAEQQQRAR